MSEIDMNEPVVDINEKNELLSRRKRFFNLAKTRKFWKEFLGISELFLPYG